MGAIKKGETQIDTSAARWFFDSVSKAFLADLVTDLVRRNAGDETLDGLDLVRAIAAEAEPIAVAREDEAALKTAVKNAAKGAAKDAARAAKP